jgi:thioredoxin reductase (NADPH)
MTVPGKPWDVVVVGAGPAGLSAAQVAGAHGLTCLCVDRLGPGGELINIPSLREYPGFSPETTGAGLAASLADAATAVGVELAFGEVRELRREEHWSVAAEDMIYAGHAVILATGLVPGTLGVPGEKKFEGLGVSRCAACDGPLYRGKDVVVVGDNRWAQQDAIDLAGIAGHVTFIWPDAGAPLARGYAAELAALSNVTLMRGRVVGLEGAQELEAVTVERGSVRERRAARAVFVQANRRAALGFAGGLLKLDLDGRAQVDGDLRTSDPWAYAVGDVRSGAPERISAAIADGQRAGLAVARLLGGRGGLNPPYGSVGSEG